MYRLIAGMLLVVASTAASYAQDLPYGPTLTFAVYRNGEPIGRHTLTFQRNGEELSVAIAVDFSVKFMGFNAYNYSHRAQEVWNGGALRSLTAQTDDNGKKYAVRAQRKASGLEVDHNAEHEVFPADLLPTSHWNLAQTSQSSLLNTQYGTRASVRITRIGREMVKTASGSVAATRYRYAGDVTKDQWFDDRGRWVKTTFKASDGSSIEYMLQE